MKGSATFSPCGHYRYTLHREWAPAIFGDSMKSMAFVMLNPSTATADRDDPTIRRCIGFARRERAHRLVVLNLYAWRATKPRDLLLAADPTGGEANDRAIAIEASRATLIICAWGAWRPSSESWRAAHDGRVRAVRDLIANTAGREMFCLGTTANGHPLHPLYLPADASLVRWGRP